MAFVNTLINWSKMSISVGVGYSRIWPKIKEQHTIKALFKNVDVFTGKWRRLGKIVS